MSFHGNIKMVDETEIKLVLRDEIPSGIIYMHYSVVYYGKSVLGLFIYVQVHAFSVRGKVCIF